MIWIFVLIIAGFLLLIQNKKQKFEFGEAQYQAWKRSKLKAENLVESIKKEVQTQEFENTLAYLANKNALQPRGVFYVDDFYIKSGVKYADVSIKYKEEKDSYVKDGIKYNYTRFLIDGENYVSEDIDKRILKRSENLIKGLNLQGGVFKVYEKKGVFRVFSSYNTIDFHLTPFFKVYGFEKKSYDMKVDFYYYPFFDFYFDNKKEWGFKSMSMYYEGGNEVFVRVSSDDYKFEFDTEYRALYFVMYLVQMNYIINNNIHLL